MTCTITPDLVVVKRLDCHTDALRVTREFERLPRLLPSSHHWMVGPRKPWLLPMSIVTAITGVLWIGAVASQSWFSNTDVANFNDWVAAPKIAGYGKALLVEFSYMGFLALKRWQPLTRNKMVGFALVIALGFSVFGLRESAARLHLGPSLLAAVAAVPAPSGGIEIGRAEVSYDDEGGTDELTGTYPEPSASRSWRLATANRESVCRAISQMVAHQPDWTHWGLCGYQRNRGRVVVDIDYGYPSSDVIDVTSSPNIY